MSELLKTSKEICKMLEIKLSRSKGQNFLITEKIYDDIIKAAEVSSDDLILEVGPGLGFLTAKMAKIAKKVIAVELDDKLAAYLRMAVDSNDIENVHIVNEDVMTFDLENYLQKINFKGRKYKIVANLPYNITSIFLRTFLSAKLKPVSLTLMLQKEVAHRIISQAPDNNLLALSIAYYGQAEIVREVKAGNFWPEPEVDSSVIKITLNGLKSNSEEDKKFFRIAKMAFSSKRKMLRNNLSAGLKIKPLEIESVLLAKGIDPRRRAEDLSLEDFKKLFAAISSFMV